MNDLLRATLRERADEQQPPALDVGSLVSAGERRVRRRRVAVSGVAAAAVATVALAVPWATQPQSQPPVAVTPGGAAHDPAYLAAVPGNAILQDGATTIETGIPDPATWARAGDAFVVLDRRGGIWRVDDAGTERVGHTDVRRGIAIVSDPRGSAVVWSRPRGDAAGSLVIEGYDAGTRRRLPARDLGPHANLVAVDGGTEYWTESRGLYSAAATGGAPEPVVSARRGHNLVVLDVAAGRMLLLDDLNHLVTAPLRDPGRHTPAGDGGLLSPAGTFVASTGDRFQVLDASTGDEVTPQAPRGATFGEWLGDSRFSVVVPRNADRSDIDVCDVPSGGCHRWGELPPGSVPEGSYDQLD